MMLIAVAIFQIVGTSFAQTPSTATALEPSSKSISYSWQECIELATKNNAEVIAASDNLRATKSLEWSARSGFLPQVTLGLNRIFEDVDIEGVPREPNFMTYRTVLTASQNLFAGFQDYGKVDQAQANTRAAQAALQVAKAKISFDLKSAYQGLIYAKEFTKLTEDIIRRRNDNMRLVELRWESGRENKGSVLLSRAYYNQAKYDNLQALNGQNVSRAQLARALGLDEALDFEVKEAIPVKDPPPRSVHLETLALQTPEYFQALSISEAADANVMVNRSTFWPTMDVNSSYIQGGNEAFSDTEDRWRVEVNLSYPLFRGMRDYANLKSASASSAAARNNFVNVNRNLLTKLNLAYSTYVEAVLKYEVDRSFREATQVRAEIARKKYNNGLLTFEDWDVIESDLISRQKAFLQSQRDRTIAEAAWEQVLGQGVIQ